MTYQVKIVDEAKAELEKELKYSSQKWGKKHAKQYGMLFRDSIKALKNEAGIYPIQSQILSDIRIKKFKGNRIIYKIQDKDNTVIILAILSQRQNYNISVLKKRGKESKK